MRLGIMLQLHALLVLQCLVFEFQHILTSRQIEAAKFFMIYIFETANRQLAYYTFDCECCLLIEKCKFFLFGC